MPTQRILIPIAPIIALIGKLLKVLPGGITKAEAKELGEQLTEVGLQLLGQVAPEHIEIKLP